MPFSALMEGSGSQRVFQSTITGWKSLGKNIYQAALTSIFGMSSSWSQNLNRLSENQEVTLSNTIENNTPKRKKSGTVIHVLGTVIRPMSAVLSVVASTSQNILIYNGLRVSNSHLRVKKFKPDHIAVKKTAI